MKKNVLKMGLVLLVLNVFLIVTSSCDDNKETSLYVILYGRGSSWSSNDPLPSDFDKMKTYIESRGCKTSAVDLMFTGSRSETDAKAKAEFDKYVSKLSHEEAAQLGLKSNAFFEFVLSRGAEQGEETEVIATWRYPEK